MHSQLILQFLIIFLFFFFWPCHVTCGIVVPRSGIEPMPLALEVLSLNHWTAREVPTIPYKVHLPFLFRKTKILKSHSFCRKGKMDLIGSAGVFFADKSYTFNQHGFKMTALWPSNIQCFLVYSLSQEIWLTVNPLSL